MANTQAIAELINRKIGDKAASQFQLEFVPHHNRTEWFEIVSLKERILIKGTSSSALSSGFHWYLKHYCGVHFSWCGSYDQLPEALPVVSEPILQSTSHFYRYDLNYCTFSYSAPFWDWDRWEKEIDWMALNGINLALNIVGLEEIWRQVLLRIGYTQKEVSEFICGPAYFAWQWMQNLDGWGGPLPKWWFGERIELGQRINARMRELGIDPVIPGFSGMVPRDFQSKFPSSRPIHQGEWCHFSRPSLLLPEDPNYDTVSDIYYEELQRLYGSDIQYFSMDPFHEGGKTDGVDLPAYAKAVQSSLLRCQPKAKWVFQAWEGNPKRELLRNIDPEHALVLDLWCESKPAWKQTEGFYGIPWVWCMIQNYGGKNGLFGDLRTVIEGPLAAAADPASGKMSGVGLAMEGIGTNPIVYDLITDMVWRPERPQLAEWIRGYVFRRYGSAPSSVLAAWRLLGESAYGKLPVQQGASESIICARPHLEILNVSTWGPREVPYDILKVREAAKLLYEAYAECGSHEGYLYDLVDVTRQALADLTREQYQMLVRRIHEGNRAAFAIEAESFMRMIRVQDKLLRTRKEFMLGPWLESAKALGRSAEEQRLFEYNARTLITLWGPERSSHVLRDYSHREWSGLIEDFYLPRWEMFLHSWSKALEEGGEPEPIDWYAWEHAWTLQTKGYPAAPSGSIPAIVEEIIDTFFR